MQGIQPCKGKSDGFASKRTGTVIIIQNRHQQHKRSIKLNTIDSDELISEGIIEHIMAKKVIMNPSLKNTSFQLLGLYPGRGKCTEEYF